METHMEFSEHIAKLKKFTFEDFTEQKTKAWIELRNPDTSPEFIDARIEIIKSEKDQQQKTNDILEAVSRHLVCNWEGLKYKDKKIPFSQKNASEFMKNSIFHAFVFSRLFDQSYWKEACDLDFEAIEKK